MLNPRNLMQSLAALAAPPVARNERNGQVVFAEAGEIFPEDVEELKKYI